MYPMVSARKIKAGEVISKDMITYRNPGTGIPAKHSNLVLGKKAVSDINENVLIVLEMVK